jgi:hypothetical protein
MTKTKTTKKKTTPKKVSVPSSTDLVRSLPSKKRADKFVVNRGQCMAVFGNFAEGFQLVGPFTDFEAAAAACPTAEWLSSVEPPSDPDTNWANDGIQFARLIAEMEETGHMDTAVVRDLAQSMDVTHEHIDEIVKRAQQVWDEIKAQTK